MYCIIIKHNYIFCKMEQPIQKPKRQYKKKVKSEPLTVEVNIVKKVETPQTPRGSHPRPNSSKTETTKKPASKFSLFVKNNYDKVRNIDNKDRMKKLAEMYKAEKSKQ